MMHFNSEMISIGLREIAIVVFALFTFSSPAQDADIKKDIPGVAVIELFTSQGDINSPPADSMLSRIINDPANKNKNIFCLAMHVDFWNRFGWKDPYSSFKFTNRLNNYSSILGDKEVYTPYMIINGAHKVDPADRKNIYSTISAVLSEPAAYSPEVTFIVFDDTLDISYDVKSVAGKTKSGGSNYIHIAIVESGIETKVTKGDNKGKTLHHQNVVRIFKTSDLNQTKGVIRIPLKGIRPSPSKKIITYIQDKKSRKVVGAGEVLFSK